MDIAARDTPVKSVDGFLPGTRRSLHRKVQTGSSRLNCWPEDFNVRGKENGKVGLPIHCLPDFTFGAHVSTGVVTDAVVAMKCRQWSACMCKPITHLEQKLEQGML